MGGEHANVHPALVRGNQRVSILALPTFYTAAGFKVKVVVALFVPC